MSASQTTAARLEAASAFRFGAFHRAIAARGERVLRLAGGALRRTEPTWFDLNDHYLADINATRAEAEAEAARSIWRTPLGAMAEGAIRQNLAKPLLPRSRLD